jgi:hypothetical protein
VTLVVLRNANSLFWRPFFDPDQYFDGLFEAFSTFIDKTYQTIDPAY